MSDPKPYGPVIVCHPRRAGKTEAVRARIYAMVYAGDLVTIKPGRDAQRYKVVLKVDGELMVSLEGEPMVTDSGHHTPGKVWLVDPATVRSIWEIRSTPTNDSRKCPGIIDICVEAGEHQPPCQCARPSGHGGPHMSGGAW